MPKIAYRSHRLSPAALDTVDKTNLIIAEYAAQGFTLTLRQIYYQFVSRDWIPNSQKSYKALGEVINKARLCGLIDWLAIIDRTRELTKVNSWEDPQEILTGCAAQFRLDRWLNQPAYMEVWIEKDALEGVIEDICNENSVPFFSCRGYTGQSAMWAAGRRLKKVREDTDREIHIVHFGDHDPSGCDMSRDIVERLEEFSEGEIEFHRAALNMDQIKKFKPPPNPAKIADPRAGAYIKQHGNQSWELDALEPKVINGLIAQWIRKLRGQALWDEVIAKEDSHKDNLGAVADHWDAAAAYAQRRNKG